ncbi:hypothetical protein [Leuconostoc gasicomitatum]|uniref:hypothetical protein n=1 Tax=Leuconostoc gasicomitatum TaxID=115778 RepID=UPI001CC7E540|nr:hypothetical protein [Leuconostoc gasicomitatum]MBZ5971626.1 hypothetical protein [Leuconostoc gasicomitatum]
MNKETTVKLVINNIDELYDLVKKAQQQSTELKETLNSIQTFIPDVDLSKKKQE